MINLYNDDCLNILKNMEDDSIDCIITSPPYNKKYFMNGKVTNQVWKQYNIDYESYSDNLSLDKYEDWQISFINLCLLKLKPNGSLFYNHKPIRHNNQVYFPLNFICRSNATIYQEIIWNRKNSPNIRKDCLLPCTERVYWLCKNKPLVYRDELDKEFISEVWNILPRMDKEHPATFPYKLAENCIKLSTKDNDLVVDPFMGSGTTGIVAKQLNRNFIGIELSKKYFDLAKSRMNDKNDLFE